ncbi:MAG: ArnT family glycosyltransferase [Vulcanimicrobiaceae bacterium]
MTTAQDFNAGLATTPPDARSLTVSQTAWWVGLISILLLALALRVIHIHNPVMDHPAWRQGDTAAIARNFAQLNFNIFYPQTDYDGPPPNYVQLELQIVPYLAAIGYKLFGIHVLFGRAISIAFSLGTVLLVALFGRWLFDSALAGLAAALLFAIFPGSVYYGRTFMPDTAMTFFLTAALFASLRTLLSPSSRAIPWREIGAGVLMTLAFLAKPVSLLAIVPVYAAEMNGRKTAVPWRATLIVAPALLLLWLYLTYVGAHAEWHWASAITQKHVVPSLLTAMRSPHALAAKLAIAVTTVPWMLATTMLGPVGFGLALVALLVPLGARSAAFLYGWAAAVAVYAFVVVTVERVDYYLYPALPLAALVGGALIARLAAAWTDASQAAKTAVAAGTVLALVLTVGTNETLIRPYYQYRHAVYATATHLAQTLQPGTLVVMAHYDPSILYYMQHKGWEEDPALWTPFDEQSAIKKGARYFVSVEDNRFRHNAELYAWMQRFPLVPNAGLWPVYETDYARVLPGAEQRWQQFRREERLRQR